MNYIITGYKEQNLFKYFEEICAIPHGSENEEKIADYLCDFAKKHNLEYVRDSLHNVLIKKRASKGYEDHPAVLLQGHTDMVCEKNADTLHDFEKDGLKLQIKDGWLSADGTTLGADDGVAIAIMMAILEKDNVKHPPLECLFTVQEETGMGGAYGFDYSLLSADRFINLDSETLDSATVSCAGGVRTDMEFELDIYKAQNTFLKITLKGLFGGHSGIDINTGRANANILMGRLLGSLYEHYPFNLSSINGGSKANAIPRECVAEISVFDYKNAKSKIKEIANTLKKELVKDDKFFSVTVERVTDAECIFSFKDTSRIISALTTVHNGVYTMSKNYEGLVESSSNLGIIETNEKNVKLVIMPRSSVESRLDELIQKLNFLGKLSSARVSHHERYPGWEYKPNSNVRRLYIDEYTKMFGKKPKIENIHAGLECGIICSKTGRDLDGVSIGAETLEIHTPEEKLNLASFENAYTLTLNMLERM